MDWDGANDSCGAAAFELAVIDDDAENTWLQGQLSGTHWIGANDRASEGDWVWAADDTPIWNPNGGELADCVQADRGNADEFYLVCGTTARIWTEAQAHCASGGMTLTTVNDMAENTWLYDQMGGQRTWLGMNDLACEAALDGDSACWVWDGEDTNYRLRDVGQPNHDGDEDCIGYWPGDGPEWHDIWCGFTSMYVCEGRLPWLAAVPEFGYQHWNVDEPNNDAAGEHCGSVATDGGWNDLGCEAPLPYVCEAP